MKAAYNDKLRRTPDFTELRVGAHFVVTILGKTSVGLGTGVINR